MAFVQYNGGKYIYEDNYNVRISVAKSYFLISWYVHGYLRNPVLRKPMSDEEINSLLRLSDEFDASFSEEIRKHLNQNCDLPGRKNEFLDKTPEELLEYRTVFLWILVAGLIFIGWSERPDDVPVAAKLTEDVVERHLKALPYIRSIMMSSVIDSVKKIGIIGKYCKSDYTIGSVFSELNNIDLTELSLHGKYLIATACYYLKNFLDYNVEILEPLLATIEKDI